MCMERVNTLVYRLQSKVPSWLTKVAPAHALVEAVGTHTQDANQISRKWTHHITTLLFFGFGLWSLWDGFTEEGEAEELAEVGAKLVADWKADTETTRRIIRYGLLQSYIFQWPKPISPLLLPCFHFSDCCYCHLLFH
ncbi:hypothetical protein I3760_15G103400 [Carya illinoinensis]|nr:hypothetical protein I3760_15G103400 [Carya illinoinensis]